MGEGRYLYNGRLRFEFRSDALDEAYRLMRETRAAVEAALGEKFERVYVCDVRADDSNFAPKPEAE